MYNQWRKSPTGSDDWVGVWGRQSLLQWREGSFSSPNDCRDPAGAGSRRNTDGHLQLAGGEPDV